MGGWGRREYRGGEDDSWVGTGLRDGYFGSGLSAVSVKLESGCQLTQVSMSNCSGGDTYFRLPSVSLPSDGSENPHALIWYPDLGSEGICEGP